MSTVQPLHPDVSVLDVAEFTNFQSFRLAVQSNPKPSLLLVEEDSLPYVFSWLSEKDDVCLSSSPQALIVHRVNSLCQKSRQMRDALTQLMARQPFDRVLCEVCLESNASNPVSLLLCDLDNFKKINDQYGHSVGDQVICVVAQLLTTHCTQAAAIGRTGGALFGVLLECNAHAAMAIAEAIRQQFQSAIVPQDVPISGSVGIASTDEPMDGHELMQRADQALYTAKANGRNCCVSFDEMQASSWASGNDVEVVGLENQARVLAERVANVITMRSRRLVSSARREADIDGLTGCFNRRYLDRQMEAEFERRERQPLSVAFLDLDHFGQVNKDFGWPTGDKILIEVCETIRRSIRATDWIGRYGGEEFFLVMPGTTMESGIVALQRIRDSVAISEFFSTCNQLVPMTLSVGATEAWETDQNYLELIERACQMTLRAKQDGRNQIKLAEN